MTDQPGYTKIPNEILDAMPELKEAELRVLLAIARKTIGWQKECDVISVSQLATQTGLTSRNTQRAITALLEKGLIKREQAGKQTYCYTLATISLRDTVENHIPSDPISLRDMDPYPLGIWLEQEPYPLGTTQKKDLKEKKEKRVRAPKQTNLDSFHEAVVIYKDLSGKRTVAPVVASLIASKITDMDLWRRVVSAWCSIYRADHVDGMLDWYAHPDRMDRKLNGHVKTASGTPEGWIDAKDIKYK